MPYKDPEKQKECMRRHLASRTPEQKAKASARQKAWFAALTPEQREVRNARAREYHRRGYKTEPEKYRARSRRNHGIADATGEVRRGKCPLCPYEGVLVCDHCKETGLTRGWLCPRCNGALGKLGDTIEGLQRALQYLIDARRAHASDAPEARPELSSGTLPPASAPLPKE